MTENRGQFYVRPLNVEDALSYKALRLSALQTDRPVFSSSYEREARYPTEFWEGYCRPGDNYCCFGLFDADRQIGITTVGRRPDDPQTALLSASYIRSEYRGMGLSRLLYEARIEWALDRPEVEVVRVAHRESNIASGQANRRFGFNQVARAPVEWGDGRIEDEVIYELKLGPLRQQREARDSSSADRTHPVPPRL